MRFLLVSFLIACSIAQARSNSVPLMNKAIDREVRRLSYQRRTRVRTRKRVTYRVRDSELKTQSERVTTQRATWGVGLEASAVGVPNNSDNDLLGLHYVFGGRLIVYGPIAKNWAVKPSVGYFFRRNGFTDVSVREHQFQGGFDILFAPGQHRSFWWMGGLAQRVDMVLTELSALRSSNTSDPEFRYRFGPTTGLAFRLGKTVLHNNVTATFQYVNRNFEPFFGFSMGLVFGPSNQVKSRRYYRRREPTRR